MDINKHGFWIGTGGVAVVLLGALGYIMFSMDAAVGKEALLLGRHQKDLDKSAKSGVIPGSKSIPNKNDVAEMGTRRLQSAQALIKTVVLLLARDEQTLERRWRKSDATKTVGSWHPEAVQKLSDLTPLYTTTKLAIEKRLLNGEAEKGKYDYSGLFVEKVAMVPGRDPEFPVMFPESPDSESPEDVAKFYRHYWVLQMMIDHILAPASKAAWDARQGPKEERDKHRWALQELLVDHQDDRNAINRPAELTYVGSLIPVRAKLLMQVSEVDKLLQAAYNTPFYVIPQETSIWMAVEDPGKIVIVVPPGEKQPSPAKLAEMASKKRPKVVVQIKLLVADVDRETLLNIARPHRELVAKTEEELKKYIDTLDSDELIKPFDGFDRKDFLTTITKELMKPKPK